MSITALAAPLTDAPVAGQESLALGVDADPDGNGPLSLATIDACTSVARDDVFDVDIYIENAQELLAWEAYIGYDPEILDVVGRDVEMFLAGNPNSSVLDVSGRVPDPGLYQVAAADISDPPTPDSGSGVLFRLSMKAISSGTSSIELVTRDVDGDGRTDLGPLLRNVDGNVLGDTNGDSIFDGPIGSAEVSVDAPCQGAGSGPASDNSSGGGVSPVFIAIAAAGGAVAALIAGLLAFRRLRRGRSIPG